MRTYTSLRELIRGAGATLIEEHLSSQAFGSANAVFACSNGWKFRLVWDGKENCGFLQSHVSGENWRDNGPTVRERLDGKFSNLEDFLSTANNLITGG